MKPTMFLGFWVSVFLALGGTPALASGNRAAVPDVTGKSRPLGFVARLNTTAGSGHTAAAGKARSVDLTGGDRAPLLNATSLKPGTDDLSHEHARGAAAPAGTSDGESGGGVVGDLIGGQPFTTAARGALTIRGLCAAAALSTATDIGVHESATPSVIPLRRQSPAPTVPVRQHPLSIERPSASASPGR